MPFFGLNIYNTKRFYIQSDVLKPVKVIRYGKQAVQREKQRDEREMKLFFHPVVGSVVMFTFKQH